MEAMIKELGLLISFKKSTDIGDIILIAAKEPQMLQYGVITEIERDDSRRDEWWHVHFTLLTIPMQEMTWTLRTPQMTGQEIFTMGGEERFFGAVEVAHTSGLPQTPPPQEKPKSAAKNPGGLRRVK